MTTKQWMYASNIIAIICATLIILCLDGADRAWAFLPVMMSWFDDNRTADGDEPRRGDP